MQNINGVNQTNSKYAANISRKYYHQAENMSTFKSK